MKNPYNARHNNGRLAQLGEHLPYKEGVTGSRPVSPTTLFCGPLLQSNIFENGRLAQLGEHLPYKEGVTGSRPVSPTTSTCIHFQILISLNAYLKWAISSVGRAPPLQGGGHWFETGIAHHLF